MNDKQLDALLEQMKNTPLPEQDGMSDEELLQSFRRRRTHDRKSMIKRVAAVMLLASLAYCFYVSYEAIVAHNALKQWNAPEKWYFLPCFDKDVRGVEIPSEGDGHFYDAIPEPIQRLLSTDSTLTDEQKAEMRWQAATFPHSDFSRIMPQNKTFGWYGNESTPPEPQNRAFGWYACEFNMPEPLHGMDLIADLGIIDDSDETFVNGTMVGAIGKFPFGYAMQTERLYHIPATFKLERNFMAVHVWNHWGVGGFFGPPVLKASLWRSSTNWNVAFLGDKDVPYAGLNTAESLDEAVSLISDYDRLPWKNFARPSRQSSEWSESSYALFKVSFTLAVDITPRRFGMPRRFASPVVLDVGPVFDVAAFFLNGRRIGLVGRFPENGSPGFTETAQRGRLIVPPDAWSKDGNNELAAIVYRERGRGGHGIPGIILANPLADTENSQFAHSHELFNVYTQSMALGKAAAVLRKAAPKDDSERAWLLSDMAHLSFLKWLDGGMKDYKLVDSLLSNIADIFDTLPAESPRQSAMQAFCIILRLAERDDALMAIVKRKFPHFNDLCIAMQPDRLTRGDWPMAYGGDSFILAAFRQDEDFAEDKNGRQVNYNLSTCADGGTIWRWQPSRQKFASEQSALVIPSTFIKYPPREWKSSGWLDDCLGNKGLFKEKYCRRVAWWNDGGMHPFDEAGPDICIQLEPAAKEQLVSLYLCDIDWRFSFHPRQQSIVVRDDDGNLLNAVWSGKTDTGVYERLLMAANVRPNFRILKHRSSCVAVAGVFRDSLPTFADGSPLAPQAIDAIVGKLPPRVAACVRIALAAESNYSVPYAKDEFGESLVRLESVEEDVMLLETLSTVDGLHPVWQCMALARFKTLLRTADKATALNALVRLKATVRGSRLIPFSQIIDDMAKKSNESR